MGGGTKLGKGRHTGRERREREEGSGVKLPGILQFCFVFSAGLGDSKTALSESAERRNTTPNTNIFDYSLGVFERGKSGTLQAGFSYTAVERQGEGDSKRERKREKD